MKRKFYDVSVGNIGYVRLDTTRKDAYATYREYVRQSKSNLGRAGGEDVTIMSGGEPIKEFYGSISRQAAKAEIANEYNETFAIAN